MPALLLDSCIWGGAVDLLRSRGHDVVWSGTWPVDPGDSTILAAAHQECRILVTLDKDFGELAVLKGHPHSGIVRLTGFQATRMAEVIDHIVTVYQEELLQGAIITVDPDRVRIRTK